MNHAEAEQIVRSAGVQGPCHWNLNRVRELIESNPGLVEAMNSLDARQMDETPQGAAAHTHSRKILEYLTDKGVRVDLFMAAAMGRAQQVAEMLKADSSLASARGAHGIPLIAHAADAPTAQAMIDAGVACDIFMAAQLGLAAHVARLVGENRTLVDSKSPNGLTPLQIAVMYQAKSVVKALLEAGAADPENAARKFLDGPAVQNEDRSGALFHTVMLAGASFRNVNLGRSTFENINFSNAAIFNVNLSNTIIDWCSIDGLTIMGVEVKPLLEAELKRRRDAELAV
jgi:hypothetical protein